MERLKGIAIAALVLIAIMAIALVFFGIGTLFQGSKAHAAEWKWESFGAAPFAKTRDEAMQKRADAFRLMDLPAPVSEQFMLATEKSGESIRIVNGNVFDVMISKRGIVHRDVVVLWKKPQRGMEYAAMAETWQVTSEGKIYTVFLPEVCFNWALTTMSVPPLLEPSAPSPFPAKRAPITGCPNGWTLTANMWFRDSLPADLRKKAEELISAAESRDSQDATISSVYSADDVSRTLGKSLRDVVKTRAAINEDLKVRLLDPKTLAVIQEDLVLQTTAGVGSIKLPGDPHQWIIETIWPADFISPTTSGGERRLRLFPEEWGRYCSMNEHGIVP